MTQYLLSNVTPTGRTIEPAELQRVIADVTALTRAMQSAGVWVFAMPLSAPASATVVRHHEGHVTLADGPFAETQELVAGFWIWQCASLQEAIAWVKRCPNPMPGDSEIEIRQILEAEDFGEALTPELRAQEQRLREQVAGQG